MHIYFSGIGGSGIGPLALIAKQAGYEVSGSDAQDSSYIKYLTSQGITDIHVGQSQEQIAAVHTSNPIDWFVYSSALPKTDPNHPELVFAKQNGIRSSKRDELLNQIITDKQLKVIAVAGTHGKTTTTAMVIWLFKQLGVPVSYSVGAKLSFGEMGQYQEGSQYFVYEADEYDRNFLAFHPYMGLISGIDWDHPDIYPTREEYYKAFRQFIAQSEHAAFWQSDVKRLGQQPTDHQMVLQENNPKIDQIKLTGQVNRQNAWLVANGLWPILNKPVEELAAKMNGFPGLSRRFEQIIPGIYSDYAHTLGKIRGALQLAHEVAGDNIVVVYEGLHNLRQHFIKDELKHIFDDIKQLYVVPSYLAREDPNLPTLSPEDLKAALSEKAQAHTSPAQLNQELKQKIKQHASSGDTVLCLTAGGTGSLDEWLRQQFKT
ncbi:MAG TPA: Mur ligase domain-containing protein [Candidatus Saccharimonadales bacterium]|nr:Mur ligase domain-containing protein [Candidatus Saccharimonadales bacterium]